MGMMRTWFLEELKLRERDSLIFFYYPKIEIIENNTEAWVPFGWS
jgi:hypothetical protein